MPASSLTAAPRSAPDSRRSPAPADAAPTDGEGIDADDLHHPADLAAIEDQLLAWADDTATPRHRRARRGGRRCSVLAARPELSVEQAGMVQAVCAHDGPVVPIAGRPGAGKTYATEAIVAAHVAAGVPIVGCAVSATAAAELETGGGVRSQHDAGHDRGQAADGPRPVGRAGARVGRGGR